MKQTLFYQDQALDLRLGESVLDCLLRHQIKVPHSCGAGVCQSCLMQSTEGHLPQESQAGLKPTLKKQRIFLACQCYPTGDLNVQLPHASDTNIQATITDKTYLNHNVIRIHLKPLAPFECEPGQYISLISDPSLIRSYSIANNLRQEGFIELHIKLIQEGLMSKWIKNHAQKGSDIFIRGPFGNCFYTQENLQHHTLVLAGTGTGLAPLYGIAQDALTKKHQGSIILFHGALTKEDLYLVSELQTLAQKHASFTYNPFILKGEKGQFNLTADLQKVVLENLPDDKINTSLFLCGAPEFVTALKTKAFLNGVASKNIYADPFLKSK